MGRCSMFRVCFIFLTNRHALGQIGDGDHDGNANANDPS